MKSLYVLYHLARADFLERTRRYSFLVVLGLVIFLGYQVAIGNMGLQLGQYRGEFNSAWVGVMMSLIASVFLGWFGFYVINNSIARDRETGVGQIIATTPMTRLLYVIGKWISNFLVLMAMVAILTLAGIVIQYLKGENMQVDILGFLNPFIFIVMPLIALVAAIAVLFETIPFLSGGFGNIVYFFLFIMFIAVVDQLDVSPVLEPTGLTVVYKYMSADILKIYPEYNGDFTLGSAFNKEIVGTFVWNGIEWSPNMILARFSLFGAALILAWLAALFFNRFDPSRTKPKRAKIKASPKPLEGNWTSQNLSTPHLTPLSAFSNRSRFLNVLLAEVKLLLKGQRWWWYVAAGGLIIASLVNTRNTTKEIILPIAWAWPVLLWSSIGNRETRHNVQQMVFSAPSPTWRQIPAQWLAGFILAVVMASGAILRLGIETDLAGLLMLLSGAIFIPSLALASGVWSGGSKLFEVLYILVWYLGPLNRIPELDYIGTTGDGHPVGYLFASIFLVVFAIFGRIRQVQS